MATAKAHAKWTGTLKEGAGSMSGASGHLDASPAEVGNLFSITALLGLATAPLVVRPHAKTRSEQF